MRRELHFSLRVIGLVSGQLPAEIAVTFRLRSVTALLTFPETACICDLDTPVSWQSACALATEARSPKSSSVSSPLQAKQELTSFASSSSSSVELGPSSAYPACKNYMNDEDHAPI